MEISDIVITAYITEMVTMALVGSPTIVDRWFLVGWNLVISRQW